jgi:hypothetical protein
MSLGAPLSLAIVTSLLIVSPFGSASAGAAPTSRTGSRLAVKTVQAPRTAPSGPPLSTSGVQGAGEETAGVPSAEGDQLVENGLSSPLCAASSVAGLSSAAQSNCETSDFVGAPAPTNNYDLDVNIDTGALGLSSGGLLSVIQDVFIAPMWEALVWVVHALVVMLQWCYTLELLGGSTMSRVAASLREAQTSFTKPWLVLVLSLASVLTVFNGLVRRRVAETLGEALLTIALMTLGLWIIADPLGTVGAVGQFANQASMGTLGAVAQGSTANAPRTLGDSMRELFEGTIEVPWCYLEFGNVHWCSDPALLDGQLRKGALSLASAAQSKLSCQPSSAHPLCTSPGESSPLAVEHSSALVREANTNGALFLAFPANKSERNSVKEESSLLHILCQREDDTKCSGPTAAQAEFRSDSGTFPRMIGVLLIAFGVIGMTMLYGLISLHLLVSTILSLFLLLLAPFAVLAPAVGGAGRALFTGWLTRLLGTIGSKLIFSFLLGVLLSMQRMLASLEPIGWWTQWFLISAFWWIVFLKRRQAFEFVRSGGRSPVSAPTRQTIGKRIQGARQAKQDVTHPVRWAKSKLLPPLPVGEELKKRDSGRKAPREQTSGQAGGNRPSEGQGPSSQGPGGQGPSSQGPGGEGSGSRGPGGEGPSSQGAGGQGPSSQGAGGQGPSSQGPEVASGSAARKRTDASDRGDNAGKPTRPERAARDAAYASDPELAEMAWLASARQPQASPRLQSSAQSQPSAQPQPSARPQVPARPRSSTQSRLSSEAQSQGRSGPRPPGRPASELAGSSPSRPTPAGAEELVAPPEKLRLRTSSEIMDHAREVAARRKRQFGLYEPGEDEPSP